MTDPNLHAFRSAIQGCGSTMGLAVVREGVLWLSLSSLTDKYKVDLLDAPMLVPASRPSLTAGKGQQAGLGGQRSPAAQQSAETQAPEPKQTCREAVLCCSGSKDAPR